MIVVIAGYSPFDRPGLKHLGAARKIEAVIGILAGLGDPVVLVNTAHNEIGARREAKAETTVIAGHSVLEIAPRRHVRRPIGKLLNLFEVEAVAERVMAHGRPRLVWIYNAYAMECLLVRSFVRRGVKSVVLELEDAVFARGRGLNPKPMVDWLAFLAARRHIGKVFAVNQPLCIEAAAIAPDPVLFPGIIRDGLAQACDARQPFTDTGVSIGYFGGLTKEKGVDRVLALARSLPEGYCVHISGAGELAEACRAAAATLGPARLRVHGLVDDETLHALIASCDVLLNLHASIADMGNGVFPFKVMESVASGRLLISTRVPDVGLESMLEGVVLVGDDPAEALEAVLQAPTTWQLRRDVIRASALRVRERFGSAGIADHLKRLLTA